MAANAPAPPAAGPSLELAAAFLTKLRRDQDAATYERFLMIMKDFCEGRIDREKAIVQVAALFIEKGCKELFAEFGAFLPLGTSESNSVALRVIAFMHGLRLNQET